MGGHGFGDLKWDLSSLNLDGGTALAFVPFGKNFKEMENSEASKVFMERGV